ncbi:MAG TPA: DUF4232 domain-containing protein [Mycobacteriales bacterium]|nr:DUF4232 domain-containing protein [Mycobacteriales bacterium]
MREVGLSVALMAALAGCSGNSAPASAPGPPPVAPVTTSVSPVASTLDAVFSTGGSAPTCAAADLRLVVQRLSEATQQESRLLQLLNAGDTTCDLEGYPSVRLSTSRGSRVAFTVGHNGDQMVTSARPRRVELRPDASAWVIINQVVCVNGMQGPPAMRISVRMPGSGRELNAGIGRYPIMGQCPPGDPGRVLEVSPIEPTVADAAAQP